MKVILFGATGMVGQGVLRECLLDPRVTQVTSVGRAAGVAVTTEQVGKAMINVAEKGYEKRVLEVADLKKVAGG